MRGVTNHLVASDAFKSSLRVALISVFAPLVSVKAKQKFNDLASAATASKQSAASARAGAQTKKRDTNIDFEKIKSIRQRVEKEREHRIKSQYELPEDRAKFVEAIAQLVCDRTPIEKMSAESQKMVMPAIELFTAPQATAKEFCETFDHAYEKGLFRVYNDEELKYIIPLETSMDPKSVSKYIARMNRTSKMIADMLEIPNEEYQERVDHFSSFLYARDMAEINYRDYVTNYRSSLKDLPGLGFNGFLGLAVDKCSHFLNMDGSLRTDYIPEGYSVTFYPKIGYIIHPTAHKGLQDFLKRAWEMECRKFLSQFDNRPYNQHNKNLKNNGTLYNLMVLSKENLVKARSDNYAFRSYDSDLIMFKPLPGSTFKPDQKYLKKILKGKQFSRVTVQCLNGVNIFGGIRPVLSIDDFYRLFYNEWMDKLHLPRVNVAEFHRTFGRNMA